MPTFLNAPSLVFSAMLQDTGKQVSWLQGVSVDKSHVVVDVHPLLGAAFSLEDMVDIVIH